MPHNFKAPTVFQVITSRNKKVFHSVVHIFTKSSGKTCLKTNECKLPKGCQIQEKEKIVTRVAFKLVAVRSISSSLLWKHQIPLIFKMFPAGSQVGLYFLLFPLFLVKYGSVFILLLCLETVFFIRSLVLHLFYIQKCPTSRIVIWKGAFDTDLLIYRGKAPDTLSLCPLVHFFPAQCGKL